MPAWTLLFLLPSLILVFVGLRHGLGALRAVRGHPNGPSLRLAALNLLEPSVTISLCLTFVTLFAFSGATSFDNAAGLNLQAIVYITPLIAAIPLSLMLLAPLFAPATLPSRDTIARWGGLRFINTVLLWMAALGTVFQTVSGWGSWLLIVVATLMLSGMVILWLSISKMLAVLRELRAVVEI